jgi:hypothetical protein
MYSWIFLDIPSFPNFKTRFCSQAKLLVSFNAQTCVVDSMSHHGNFARGKGGPQRLNLTAANLPPLSLATAVTAAAAVVSQESFHFSSLVASNDLNLGERWGRVSFQGR